jgi:hypothetical protein
MRALREFGPAPDAYLIRMLHGMLTPENIRGRRKELCRRGQVRFTGTFRRLKTGRLARVWEAV